MSVQSIDDLNRTQAELAYSKERLQLALESARSLAWEWDLTAGRDVCFGDLHTILGMPENTFAGTIDDFYRGLHPDDRERVLTAIEEAKRSGVMYEEEFRVRWQDGTVRWVASKGRVYYSTDGRAVRMLGIATDITDRRTAEESLRRKESELVEAQRLAAIGSWQWDCKTQVVLWSDELYRIAGLDRGSPAIAADNQAKLYPPEHWERIARAADEALRSGAPYELDVEMVAPDGSRKWITARGEARRDDHDRIVGLRGTVQDVTSRKLAEEALSSVSRRLIEAQESERTRIARDLHDDIGQRLALLSVELAQLRELAAHSPVAIHHGIDAALSRTAEIAADVHALSHELHSSRLQLLGVVAAIGGFCTEIADQLKVTIDFTHEGVPDNVPPDIALCLFRVLQEALRNAGRHSDVRSFTVNLRGTPDAIGLTVRDAGRGFDPQSASQRGGLGLTSMRERLKLVGGELVIESEPAKGTTIIAHVPVSTTRTS
jgi:PAS domain S-box-containing protein